MADAAAAATPPSTFRAQEALVLETEAGNAAAAHLAATLQALLVEKGLLTPGEVEAEMARLDVPGLALGARLVARAWVDDAFKARLLGDGKSAAAEFGIKIGEAQLVVVANTARLHNLVTCTLCSCYPRSLLGQPPLWYVSKAYRARAVREPRAVLREFGLDLPMEVQLRVHDSNADMRYLVLPMRPHGTDGWRDDALAALVSRDSLIGTAVVPAPSASPRIGTAGGVR